MKKIIAVAAVAMAFASQAQADGFKCVSEDGVLAVKAFNYTDASRGTRNGAIMILSDNTVSHGRKTIARFTEAEGNLENHGAYYEANVDLRFANSNRGGEYIGGTRLGQVDAIILNVAFTYGDNLENGAQVPASLKIVKRNGNVIRMKLICDRYLAN